MYSRAVEACALEPDLAILPNRELLLFSLHYCVQGEMYSRVVEACALEPDLTILPNRELLLLSHSYCVQGEMYSRVVEACALEPDLAILPNTPATLPLLLCAGRYVLKGGGGLCPGA